MWVERTNQRLALLHVTGENQSDTCFIAHARRCFWLNTSWHLNPGARLLWHEGKQSYPRRDTCSGGHWDTSRHRRKEKEFKRAQPSNWTRCLPPYLGFLWEPQWPSQAGLGTLRWKLKIKFFTWFHWAAVSFRKVGGGVPGTRSGAVTLPVTCWQGLSHALL
jgi:hypothetical protein